MFKLLACACFEDVEGLLFFKTFAVKDSLFFVILPLSSSIALFACRQTLWLLFYFLTTFT